MSPIYVPGKVVLQKQFTWNESVWNPSMISTALWLDAADAGTIISSGGRISQWSDKSGNSRNATQATGAQQPKITTAAQNGRNVVEFDPLASSYQELAFSRLTSLGHVFFVAQKNNVNDSSVVLDDVTTDTRAVTYGDAAGSNFVVQSLAPTNTGATRGVWHIAEVATDGTNATLGIDATRVTAADADRLNTDRIGTYNNSGSANSFRYQYSYRGKIGEIIISSSVFSTENRQKIEGYLAHKWGLTANLPAGHPYKTVGPTP